ncbi:flavodoxin domain-containing protein [Clostridiaceae bacterium HSG29]|nr:flavodoxin domain-containing protein [Clostridiaceae bacterium HSG29]
MWYMDVNIMYFSATGTTKKIIKSLANNFLEVTDNKIKKEVDFTLIHNRKEGIDFNKNDILFIGVPVYAGRVPNILLKYLNKIKGNGAFVIPVVVYGNRNYDDALIELNDIVKKDWITNGMHIIAVGADMAGKQELESDIFKDARIFVDSKAQCIQRGETRNPIIEEKILESDIQAELSTILLNNKKGRISDKDITIFDTTGMGVQDNTLAFMIYHKALALKIGKKFDFLG